MDESYINLNQYLKNYERNYEKNNLSDEDILENKNINDFNKYYSNFNYLNNKN